MVAPSGRGSAAQIAVTETSPKVANQKHPSASPRRVRVGDRQSSGPSGDGSSSVPGVSVATLSLSDHELLRATVTGSPIALTVVDVKGVALLWNPAAERIFGWSAKEVLGHPLRIIDEGSQQEFDRLRSESVAGHEVLEVEVRRLHRDGHLVDAAVSTVAMRDAAGQVIGVLASYKDISKRKAAEA